jgi:Ca2+-binding EF-hand superfamily protein
MSEEEIQQKLATINLFENFDFDGSGALDSMELTALYNENGVKLSEDEVKELYNDESILFTLDSFGQMNKDCIRLRNYREALGRLKHRLQAQANSTRIRGFIPTTFDAMMLDFGNRV